MWGLSDQALGAIVSAIALIAAAALQGPKLWKNRRSDIVRDIEIYKSLPDESTSKNELLKRIDGDILSLSAKGEKTRNSMNAGIGIVFLVIAGWTTYLAIAAGQWWSWVFVPVLLFFWVFGLYGTIEGLTKHHRDASGKVISKSARNGAGAPQPESG